MLFVKSFVFLTFGSSAEEDKDDSAGGNMGIWTAKLQTEGVLSFRTYMQFF